MEASAIVLDGNLKSALTTVRSLGSRHITVACGSDRKTAMALHSKYTERAFIYPSAKENKQAFVECIRLLAKELFTRDRVKPVVFTFSDATTSALFESYEVLSPYLVMTVPPRESFEKAANKRKTYELASSLGIPVIKSYGETELSAVSFPVVVKYCRSIVWNNGIPVTGSAEFAFSQNELQTKFAEIEKKTNEKPLVQAFVYGDEYGVEMICDKGAIHAQFVHKRIRSLSPRGGAAVVKETAAESKETDVMRTYAKILVDALQWHGPVMVEFKVDRSTNKVLLMEINGRFWGSLPLAVRAGVDFPMEHYRLFAREGEERPKNVPPLHVRTRHFLGDCKWLYGVWFNHDPLRSLLYPSRLRALWDFTLEIFRSKGDIFRLYDLKPSMYEYIDILRIWK